MGHPMLPLAAPCVLVLLRSALRLVWISTTPIQEIFAAKIRFFRFLRCKRKYVAPLRVFALLRFVRVRLAWQGVLGMNAVEDYLLEPNLEEIEKLLANASLNLSGITTTGPTSTTRTPYIHIPHKRKYAEWRTNVKRNTQSQNTRRAREGCDAQTRRCATRKRIHAILITRKHYLIWIDKDKEALQVATAIIKANFEEVLASPSIRALVQDLNFENDGTLILSPCLLCSFLFLSFPTFVFFFYPSFVSLHFHPSLSFAPFPFLFPLFHWMLMLCC